MEVVVDVLAQLENFQITKETLEVDKLILFVFPFHERMLKNFSVNLQTTRLGKYINELRRKTQDRHLASRAKSLVKSWRQLVVTASAANPNAPSTEAPGNGNAVNNFKNVPKNNGSVRVSPPIIPSGASTSTTAQSVANNRNLHNSNNNNNKRTSSLPSSGSTSPGLSRPNTPPTQTSRPVSPYNDDTGVSKTNAANKRLRKETEEEQNENEEPPAKRPNNNINSILTNGHNNADFLLDGDTRDSVISASSNPPICDNSLQSTQKLRNQNNHTVTTKPAAITAARRKTRGSAKSKAQEQPDVLEQQMLSVRKAAGKVRTTQEIVQELALRSQSPGAFVNKSTGGGTAGDNNGGFEINETKVELMNRFFESQDNLPDTTNGLSPPLSRAPSPDLMLKSAVTSAGPSSPDRSTSFNPSRSVTPFVPNDQSAESIDEIMSRLPLIKASDVMAEWETGPEEEEDQDEEEIEGLIPVKPREKPEVTEEMVKRLHSTNVDTFNGNFNHKGEFREWHEVLTKETKDGDLLYVLPYSVIE